MEQIFNELSTNTDFLNREYDVLYGRLPKEKDELVLIVDENNEIVDYVLYAIGIKDQREIEEVMKKMTLGEKLDEFEETSYSFDEILKVKYKLILNTDYYKKENGIWKDKKDDINYMSNVISKGLDLKIVGIIKPSQDSNVSINNGVGYTKELTEYVINNINNSDIVKDQLNNKEIDVFTNKPFDAVTSYEMNLTKVGVVDLSE